MILPWIAFLTTIIGCVINAWKWRSCFVVWSLGALCWIVYALPRAEYAILAQNITFLLFNYYGWRQWRPR